MMNKTMRAAMPQPRQVLGSGFPGLNGAAGAGGGAATGGVAETGMGFTGDGAGTDSTEGGGGGVSAGGGGTILTGAPQLWQNFMLSANGLPQLLQNGIVFLIRVGGNEVIFHVTCVGEMVLWVQVCRLSSSCLGDPFV